MVNEVSQNPANGNQNLNGYKIENLADGVNPTDAATVEQTNTTPTSGSATVRQSVQKGPIGKQGRPNLLIQGPNGNDVKSQSTNNLLDKNRFYYAFDSVDSSSNFTNLASGATGTTNSSVQLSSNGIRGHCAQFASGGQITINNQLQMGPNNFFVSLWIKATTKNSLQVFLDESTSTNVNSFMLYIDANNNYGITTYDGSGTALQVLTTATYDITQWHNIIYDRKSGTCDIYVDGVKDNSGSIFSGNITANGDSVFSKATNFAGYLDEFGIWMRNVTSSDISLLYNNPLNVDLISYYSLDGNANDQLGVNNGTVNGSVSFVSGKIGQAASFSGGYITVGNALNVGTGDFSISCWVNFKSITSSQVICETSYDESSSTNDTFSLYIEGSTSKLRVHHVSNGKSAGGFYSSTSLTANTYYHLTLTRTTDKWSIYINNSLDATNNLYNGDVSGDKVGSISRSTTSPLTGGSIIDEFAIWDRALDSNEISLLYNGGNGRSYTNLRDLNPISYQEFAYLVETLLSYGDGFSNNGEKNIGVPLTTSKTWNTLPNNSQIYLYLDYNQSTNKITAGHTTVAPQYESRKPATARVGTYWYPIDHRSRGEYLDNTGTWNSVLRIFIGECLTDVNGNVINNSVVTYAYQGRSVTDPVTAPNTASITLGHNLGTTKMKSSVIAHLKSTNANWPNGTQFDVTSGNPSGWVFGITNETQAKFVTHGSTWPNFTDGNGGAASTDPSWTSFSIYGEFNRSF